MRVTITGATGFIGKALIDRYAAEGCELCVLARKQPAWLPAATHFFRWDAIGDEFPLEALEESNAVIHLAGEPVAQRWTPEVKHRIRESRLHGTRRLVEALSTISRRPEVLVSASAIGYYGSRGDEMLSEESKAGSGFLAETCIEWERAATLAESLGMRVVMPRIGVVLSPEGGALAQMLPPFRLGAGGKLASGRQWMSWIHRTDLIELIRWCVAAPPVGGAVNATAPNPEMNADFTRMLAQALHRPAVFPVPSFALRLMFGEMAEVLLGSQRVLPRKATGANFVFQFAELGPALADLFG